MWVLYKEVGSDYLEMKPSPAPRPRNEHTFYYLAYNSSTRMKKHILDTWHLRFLYRDGQLYDIQNRPIGWPDFSFADHTAMSYWLGYYFDPIVGGNIHRYEQLDLGAYLWGVMDVGGDDMEEGRI